MWAIWIALSIAAGVALSLRYRYGAALMGAVVAFAAGFAASPGEGTAHAAAVGLGCWTALQLAYLCGAWLFAARRGRGQSGGQGH